MRNLDYPGAHEGAMMQNQLATISRVSNALYDELEPSDQLPNWTLTNVAIAKDRLTTAMQYLTSKFQQKRSHKMNPFASPAMISTDKFALDAYGNLDDGESSDFGVKAYKKLASLPFAQDMLPSEYGFKVCDCKTNPTVCVPVSTEKKLQKQRQFAYMIGGPAIVVAAYSLENPLMKYGMVALGLACSLTHYAQYKAVAEAGKEHNLG